MKHELSNDVLNDIKNLAIQKANELNLRIVSVEWVYEEPNNVLRIIADEDQGLTIESSSLLNEALSDALDELDPIEDEYVLEVSSMGCERELKTNEDIISSINEYVHVDLNNYVSINQKQKFKSLEGYLEEVNDNNIVVLVNYRGQKKHIPIQKDNIQLIRLAIKF